MLCFLVNHVMLLSQLLRSKEKILKRKENGEKGKKKKREKENQKLLQSLPLSLSLSFIAVVGIRSCRGFVISCSRYHRYQYQSS